MATSWRDIEEGIPLGSEGAKAGISIPRNARAVEVDPRNLATGTVVDGGFSDCDSWESSVAATLSLANGRTAVAASLAAREDGCRRLGGGIRTR
jgi:hypothetical protein